MTDYIPFNVMNTYDIRGRKQLRTSSFVVRKIFDIRGVRKIIKRSGVIFTNYKVQISEKFVDSSYTEGVEEVTNNEGRSPELFGNGNSYGYIVFFCLLHTNYN